MPAAVHSAVLQWLAKNVKNPAKQSDEYFEFSTVVYRFIVYLTRYLTPELCISCLMSVLMIGKDIYIDAGIHATDERDN